MKKSKIYLALCLMIFAVLSFSVFSFTAAAAQQDADNETAAVQTAENEEGYALLKGEIGAKQILIAVGVSVLATGITVFLIFHSYKTNGQSEPYTYKKNAPLELSDAEDIHVDTIVNRRKIERDRN